MGSGLRGTGQLKGTGFLKNPGKPGSKGPDKGPDKGQGSRGSAGPSKNQGNGKGQRGDKAGSKGPNKGNGNGNAGGNGPAKAGGIGPVKAQGIGPKDSGGPKAGGSGGPRATVTRIGDTTTITDAFGAFVSNLLDLSQTQNTTKVTNPAGTAEAGQTAGAMEPQDINALKEDIARALGQSPAKIGSLFKESGGATWSVADLNAIKDIVGKIPEADRRELANTSFERTKTLPSEDGKPNYGHIAFSRSDFQDRAVIKIADVASGLDAAGKATGPNVVGQVVAHEMGHIVQGDGRWNSNEVREFGKLSHWVRQGPPETLVNGYDDFFRTVDFETRDYAKNSTNFVSDYAKESAVEDFAESYRVYLSNPGELMAKAPDKFLYINADSRKYSPEQVQGFANVMGVDLPFVMAGLGKSNLRPGTLAGIATQNGLAVPGAGSGAGDAIAAIQEKALDPAFGLKLREDPQAALGDATWSKLSPSEQALLGDDAYVNKLLAGTAANKTTPQDTITDGDVAGWKGFLNDILLRPPTDPRVLQAFTGGNANFQNPTGPGAGGPAMLEDGPRAVLAGEGPEAQVRYDYLWEKLHDPDHWSKLSPEMQQVFNSDNGKKFIAQMASDKNNLDVTKLAWTKVDVGLFGRPTAVPDLNRFDNIRNYIDSIGPADLEALGSLVKRGITDDEAIQVGKSNKALAAGGSLPAEQAIPAL